MRPAVTGFYCHGVWAEVATVVDKARPSAVGRSGSGGTPADLTALLAQSEPMTGKQERHQSDIGGGRNVPGNLDAISLSRTVISGGWVRLYSICFDA